MDSQQRKRLRVHLQLIDSGVAPVVLRYAEHIECRAGCSDCCSQSFLVSEVEGALLREGLLGLESAARSEVIQRARSYEAGSGQACPALSSSGRCTIYEHRPRICRKYGIPLWDPEQPERVTTCPKNFRSATDIDAELIAEPQATWAQDWIRLRDELELGPAKRRPIADWLLDR